MKQQLISIINGANIVTVEKNGEIFVPIKPICDAIGIDVESQRDKIQNDEILSSVAVLSPATGADGKTYEMHCLPLKYVYGWIFTINPKNVAPDAREAVSLYRRECYDALYEHFTASLRRRIEENEAEIAALKEINDAKERVKIAQADVRKGEQRLEMIRKNRLDVFPSINFDV